MGARRTTSGGSLVPVPLRIRTATPGRYPSQDFYQVLEVLTGTFRVPRSSLVEHVSPCAVEVVVRSCVRECTTPDGSCAPPSPVPLCNDNGTGTGGWGVRGEREVVFDLLQDHHHPPVRDLLLLRPLLGWGPEPLKRKMLSFRSLMGRAQVWVDDRETGSPSATQEERPPRVLRASPGPRHTPGTLPARTHPEWTPDVSSGSMGPSPFRPPVTTRERDVGLGS